MKLNRTILFLLFTYLLAAASLHAQTFEGEWTCDYATYDTSVEDNAVGQSVIDVAVIKENTFVVLSHRVGSAAAQTTHFLVGYTDADSANGRMGTHYGGRGDRQLWASGFDQIEMLEAVSVAASTDSLIYVANNDIDRNILVFKLGSDSVESTEFRMVTGADSLWAIHVDDEGRVYVSSIKDSVTPSEILIFDSIEDDAEWGSLHQSAPAQTIVMPSPGSIRGITTNADGSILYATNYTTKEVYCYVRVLDGSYVLYPAFNLTFSDPQLTQDSTETLEPGPWGISLMRESNILVLGADVSFRLGNGYQYGKIFFLNPNTAEILDTIDVAQWNFIMTGGFSTRGGGNTPGNASGYTSTYNVSFDESYNVYSHSYYGWTAEKWSFSGQVPIIPLLVTGIERDETIVPDEFALSQNYPNPFNPSTTFEFSLTQDAEISLKVFSVTGELVATLINSAAFSQGSYKVTFDASKLSSGTYIYVLDNGSQQISKKMTLLK
jgi:hypothetical protein